jgi:hypothetical protein
MGKEEKKIVGSNRVNFDALRSETYKQRVKKEELAIEKTELQNMEKQK